MSAKMSCKLAQEIITNKIIIKSLLKEEIQTKPLLYIYIRDLAVAIFNYHSRCENVGPDNQVGPMTSEGTFSSAVDIEE
jgi:hypothetical protein